MASKIDMSNVTEKDMSELLDMVRWAITFSNNRHSPGCAEDMLCNDNGVCSHVGFYNRLKEVHGEFVKKVGLEK